MQKFLSRLIIFIFFGFLFYYIIKSSNENSTKRENFAEKGNLAVGIIKSKSYSGNRSVSYKFYVENNEFSGGDTRYYMDSNEAYNTFLDNEKSKPGKKFLVIYDENIQKKSIIRLDYPIKDSTDFKRYLKEFEQLRNQKIEE